MIHHLSLPAQRPQHVAEIIAEISGGKATRLFPGTDTYAAWYPDEHGTCVEVYPLDMSMEPGPEGQSVVFGTRAQSGPYIGTHAAISVPCDADTLLSIAAREGWRAEEFDRGPFRVVEFWLENRVLIEFLTPDMAEQYRGAVTEFLNRDDWA